MFSSQGSVAQFSMVNFPWEFYMGVSENRQVPLNPMVLLIIIPFLNGYFIGNIPYFQTNPYGDMKGMNWMTDSSSTTNLGNELILESTIYVHIPDRVVHSFE